MADGGEGSSRSVIPGPAGIVQHAMLRRERGKGPQVEPQPTQEYLERALKEPQYDDGFTHIAWRTLVNFGYLDIDELISISKISEIARRYHPNARIPLVVGVVKTTESNGLGDIIIELKDETGSIKGSVHRKVLQDPYCGKIEVGTTMVITDAVIFSPSRTAHYLNITQYNVSVVVTKEGEVITALITHPPELVGRLTVEEYYQKYCKK